MRRSYCNDLVQKRLHHDVLHLIEAMRAGFNLVSRDNGTPRFGVKTFGQPRY
jgi:hypothetical protein